MLAYDIFLCHASEDKEHFVRPLATALARRGARVWYDEYTLRPGDSLRAVIDAGLTNARYGVVVLSPRFFGKRWTTWELNGLVHRHLGANYPLILPVWLEVTAAYVAQFSASLADIVAVRAEVGIEAAADAIVQLVGPSIGAVTGQHHALLQRVLASVPRLLGINPAATRVSLLVRDGSDLSFVGASDSADDNHRHHVPIKGSVSGLSFNNRTIVNVDIGDNLSIPYSDEHVHSLLAMPLLANSGQVYGVLSLASRDEKAFAAVEFDRVNALAQIMGPLLEHYVIPLE